MASSQRKSCVKLNKKHWDAPWKVVKRIGDWSSGNGKLIGAVGVAINKDGEVAVADYIHYSTKRINVYDINHGQLKMIINTTKKSLYSNAAQCESNPHDVAVAHDGNYILSDRTQSLTIYGNKGNYVRQIPITDLITARGRGIGLSINSQNHILVGDDSDHLSVYNYSNGSLISRVNTPNSPEYISASSHDDRIIISGSGSAHVINAKGQTIHALCPPADVVDFISWRPSGVCTIGEGEEEEVFICNSNFCFYGVYRFSLSTGKYLGCVTTELDGPRGIAITDDGKLVVADDTCVKIFMPNTQ